MTPLFQSQVVAVRDDSDVGVARRLARRRALELGLSEVVAERAAIVATEATRNLVQHAGGGELLLRALGGGTGLELLALDRGPGLRDVARAMQDGYSTAGTAGQGLGAMSRLSAEFDLYSLDGHGTAVLARVGDAGTDADVGAVCVAVAGEDRCGDAWSVQRPSGRCVALVADGLGHGAQAADAAELAVGVFGRSASLAAPAILESIHAALRSTRGAAAAVADLTVQSGPVRYAAVGNISSALVAAGAIRRMVSLPGTVGLQARRIQQFAYEWAPEAVLVMHSDGVATRWDLSAYPGLVLRHPSLVAGVLYRDFARHRDDATVLVVRRPR